MGMWRLQTIAGHGGEAVLERPAESGKPITRAGGIEAAGRGAAEQSVLATQLGFYVPAYMDFWRTRGNTRGIRWLWWAP
jgi:hypothetical protein